MKLLTIAVPCYNSAAYMKKCIESLLPGGEDVEIIIVNDGSTDETREIAEKYRDDYPGIVKVVNKENGGHGSAVNAGIKNATGLFFKVVDSDDWVRADPYQQVLETLRSFAGADQHLDMLICNYIYNKVGEKKHKVIQYRSFFPTNRLFTWKDAGHFRKGHYLLMHSVIYRTKILKDMNLELPEHCFYVDNLYVFEPLPYVKNMYYLDINFYSYYIGRSDQSVNEKVMISRLDQQIRVNKLMFDYFSAKENRARIDKEKKCRTCMYNYLEIITTISSVLAQSSGTEEDLARKDELWKYMKEKDFMLYLKLRSGIFGAVTNLPGRGGRAITVHGYRLAQRFFKFN